MDAKTAPILTALFITAVGLFSCFWGYRLFRVMLALWGFMLGAVAGVAIQTASGHTGTLPAVLGLVIGGLLGAVLLAALYYLGVLVAGAVAGAVLGYHFALIAHIPDARIPIVVAAVIVAILAVALQKVVIMLVTAFSGAWIAVNGGANLLGGRSVDWLAVMPHELSLHEAGAAARRLFEGFQEAARGHPAVIVLWVLLAVAGFVLQRRRK